MKTNAALHRHRSAASQHAASDRRSTAKGTPRKRFAYLVTLVALFALLICANAAIGSVRPDDHATHGPGVVAVGGQNDIVRPDDRSIHGLGAVALEQGTRSGLVPTIPSVGPEAVRADGFDWLDAGIGAAAVLGLGLIVMGGVAFALRRTQAPSYS